MVFDKSKKMKWLKVEKSLKEFCLYSYFYKMDESTASEKYEKIQKTLYIFMKGKYKEISFSYVYDQLAFILDIQRTPNIK